MTLPNFLIIGAAKSGTTALYEYVRQHPEVYMTDPKEPFFFALEGQSIQYNGPGDQAYADLEMRNTLETYEALFDDVTTEKAVGEASIFYLYTPEAAHNIKRHIPDVKMLVMLRNPVSRAYSSFTHMMRENREPLHDFAEALADEPNRIRDKWHAIWHYQAAGLYADQVAHYFNTFSRDQVQVYLQDDMKADTQAVVRSVFEFIGVNPDYQPDLDTQHNVSYIPRNLGLQRVRNFLLQPNNPIKEALKPFIPARVRTKMVHSVADQIESINFERVPMVPTVHNQLVDYFHDDIMKLQDLIDRDLSHWLKKQEDSDDYNHNRTP